MTGQSSNKDEWSSSFRFGSGKKRTAPLLLHVSLLAEVLGDLGVSVDMLMQHSLREGMFAVLLRVSFPGKGNIFFGHKSESPERALSDAARTLLDVYERKLNEEPQPEKKSEARKGNGRRHVRKSTARKRSNGVRKGRRKKNR